MEITKLGDQKLYKARLPMAAAQNLPMFSQKASPVESNLSFTFFKEGKSGVFGGQPSVEMTLNVVPNVDLADHLIVTQLSATMTQMGKTKTMDMLQYMQQKEPVGIYDKNDLKGFCVKNLTTTNS